MHDMMHYHEWSTTERSGGLTVCGWRLRGGMATDAMSDGIPDTVAEPALPDGCPELLFNFGDPFEHHDARGRIRRQPRAFLVGQITRPFDVRPTGRIDLVALRFEAHGVWGLTTPHAPPADDWIDADSAIATHRLSAMSSVRVLWHTLAPLDDAGREQAVNEWLAHYAKTAPRADEVVMNAVRAIRVSGGSASIDALAEVHGIALRTLQRRFSAQLGVSPKLFARIVRFHRVCTAWRREPGTLARVAADAGYCDESHLIRDFRAFVGEPPTAFMAALPAFTALFIQGDGGGV